MLDRSAVLLEDKVAVVTGGGGGMGRSISETFAEHGARVVVAERDERRCRDTVEAIEKRGGEALAQVVDVESRVGVEALTRATLDAFGQVDVLVNNLGDHLRLGGPFLQSAEEDWERLHSVNLLHVLRCCHALAPHMIQRGAGGSIINISTIEAFRGIPNHSAYSAYNAGITGFTKSFALEVAPEGIRVNAIAPETTDTIQVPLDKMIPEAHRSRLQYFTPLGRFGTPDDAAGCALFLASELSAWVTGTTLHMDGGALAAGGFYRVQKPGGRWTNMPLVTGAGTDRETREG